MQSHLSRRTVIGGLVAMAPAAALAQTAAAPAGAPQPPKPITGPQIASPPTDLKAPYPAAGKVNRLDPRLDALIDADAKVEKVCDGFLHAEGPVWVGGPNGYLLVSVKLKSVYCSQIPVLIRYPLALGQHVFTIAHSTLAEITVVFIFSYGNVHYFIRFAGFNAC